MRIAVLTFHYCYNYGALLQAYATRRVLERFGHEVCFPDYVPPYFRQFVSSAREWKRNWGLRSGRFWSGLPITLRLKIEVAHRRKAFDRFRQEHLPRVSYASKDALAADVDSFGAFWVGSDQVWNMNWMESFDGFYFLDFIAEKSSCRRIGYAPCFGRKDQPPELLKRSLPLIQKFDMIGSRNDVTRDLVQERTGKSVEMVCDPTLLWDFSEFVQKQSSGDYILLYSLDKRLLPLGVELADFYKKHYNLKIIQLLAESPVSSSQVDERAYGADPADWVSLLYNAKFIVTDSFHACLFALKFNKKFVAYSSGWRKMRLADILAKAGMSERLVVDTVAGVDLEALTGDPDFSAFGVYSSEVVERSRNFIQHALASKASL